MTDDAPADPVTVDTAICFDLDGTLLAYDREYDAIVRETLETEFAEVTDEMVETYLETFGTHFEAVDPDPCHAAMAAVDDGDVDEAVVEALVGNLLDAEKAATTVPEAAYDCIATLAEDESVAVCVVTDGLPEWQRAKLDHHGLSEHVTTVVTSYGAGGHKESGEPYDAIREQVDAAEYVMIGDDYAGDVEAARAAGFVPIHYEDDGPDFFGTLDALL